ncbi:MAG TPA: triose-phosphate isomerase [Candidatus Paceibacterota bacterium]|nr:triose-phosphate isomerase [Candidatus Paceibacterota bacterium]
MQKKIIIGNWKTNPNDPKTAKKLFTDIAKNLRKFKNSEVVVCPPPFFQSLFYGLKGSLILGAQDTGLESVGSFTGTLSPRHLKTLGVKYSIVGHSESRLAGTTDEVVSKKVQSLLSEGVTPVLCVGESVRDNQGEFFKFIKNQLSKSLSLVPENKITKIIVAYEPIWAIGSNAERQATPDEAKEMALFIKKTIRELFKIEKAPKILYGGSVDEVNAENFLSAGGVDGLLVGRASLNAKKFLQIISYAG